MKLTKTGNNTYILEGIVECGECKGTGLYKGMAERDGAAVICVNCEGTGQVKIKEVFKEFVIKRLRKDVTRVYETSMGYGITDKDIYDEKRRFSPILKIWMYI